MKDKIALFGIILLLSAFTCFPQTKVRDVSITISFEERELAEVFQQLKEDYNVSIAFSNDVGKLKSSGSYKNEQLESVLNAIAAKEGLEYKVVGDQIVFKKRGSSKPHISLTGVIVDTRSGERLAGATVRYINGEGGVVTNQYGFFSLTNKKGLAAKLQVTYIGYLPHSFDFSFERDSVLTISLEPLSTMLDEVVIDVGRSNEKYSYEAGKVTFTAEKIRSIGSLGGEPDVLKSLQFLPGVQTGNEGTTNLSVRGGSHDQNLILLDEAPVYNAAHALSFFSVLNVDAVSNVDFYKSNIPVKFGGRLSSVVDVRMKEGNRKKAETRGSIGVISSKLTTEGPLFKNAKWSYMVSGRYSYAGEIVNGIYFVGREFLGDPTANRSTTNNTIHFYDLNGKINYQLNEKNQFYLSAYSGSDDFYFNHITRGYDLQWGNRTLTFRWNHIFTKRLFANTTFNSSNYNYEYKLLNNTQFFLWSAGLNEKQIKQDYDWYLNDSNHYIFGFGLETINLNPGKVRPRDENAASIQYELDKKSAVSSNVYVGGNTKIGSFVELNYGLRYNIFGLTGKRVEYTFDVPDYDAPIDSVTTSETKLSGQFEPRASIHFTKRNNSFSVSYDRTVQFLHLLANSSVGLPTDIWWPSSSNIKPQYANIYVISFDHKFSKGFQINLSTFFKSLNNVLDFKDNAMLFVNKYVESQLLQGKGVSYGAEVFIAEKLGKLNWSASYTYAKTYNEIEGVNKGEPYPNRYDKRHNLAMIIGFPISPKINVSSNFVLTTGGALTMPDGTFLFDGIAFNAYGTRNSYRLPVYNRVDLTFKYENQNKNQVRKVKQYWLLDIYNVYGRKNPFTIYSVQADNGFQQTQTHAIFLYRIVPTLSYNFKF